MPGYVRAEQRRAQLLDAAVEVLVREGLDELTLRDVAAEAGVRLSTLQYIFPSRSELVRALTGRVLARAGREQFARGPTVWRSSCTVSWTGTRRSSSQSPRSSSWSASRSYSGPTLRRRRGSSRLPADWPRMSALIPARLEEICERADEEYDLAVAEMTRIWTRGLIGLIFQVLLDPTSRRFQRDADLLVGDLVATGGPSPAPLSRRG